jgi:atypical dual specificity phosphatase
MAAPENFSWIEEPRLAAHALPMSVEELTWLRQQGIELVITLTESPLKREWLADASLLGMHVPIVDMEPPTLEQARQVISGIKKAHERGMGVSVHCYFGRGRTGTILACWFVDQGMSATQAIRHVRRLRPGSVETPEQELLVQGYEKALRP